MKEKKINVIQHLTAEQRQVMHENKDVAEGDFGIIDNYVGKRWAAQVIEASGNTLYVQLVNLDPQNPYEQEKQSFVRKTLKWKEKASPTETLEEFTARMRKEISERETELGK